MAMQEKLLQSSTQPQPIVFRSKKQKHHDVFFKESEYAGENEVFHCFVGLPSDHDKHHFMSAEMKIIDVARYEHFDHHEYPENSSYFMYGDKENAFLFHIPSRSPDFFQVLNVVNNFITYAGNPYRYISWVSLYMLWFNFILGSNFIFLCFKLIITHYHTQKQRKIKFEPRIKLNHNIYLDLFRIKQRWFSQSWWFVNGLNYVTCYIARACLIQGQES